MLALFHLIAVIHYFFGVYYLFAVISDKDVAHRGYEFGGTWIYLTNLNFVS